MAYAHAYADAGGSRVIRRLVGLAVGLCCVAVVTSCVAKGSDGRYHFAVPTTAPPAVPSTAGGPVAAPVAPVAPVGVALPNPQLTPGAVNPDVTPATLSRTICVRGWTATVRPPVSVTEPMKIASLRRYAAVGEPWASDQNPRDYEFDHDVPLEVGGATGSHPGDEANLWPQPYEHATAQHGAAPGTQRGSETKDHLENYVRARVCAGSMSLAGAQQQFLTNWYASWVSDGQP